jgi:hypothetical protein
MTLASTKLVPELQYYFENFIRFSIVNKNQIPAPVTINSTYIPQQSFIELLFNDDYSYTSYKYLYTESATRSTIPLEYLDRIMLYSSSGKYMELGDTGENLFLLQPDDFTMLDALLSYRVDSTALTMIDTTGVNNFDTTSVILYSDFSSLSTSLSKLIYLYLDLKIRENTDNYNNTDLISSGNLLSSCYEAYVLDEFFKIISARGI